MRNIFNQNGRSSFNGNFVSTTSLAIQKSQNIFEHLHVWNTAEMNVNTK